MNDRVGVNLLTRLRVDFGDLKLHKFDHRLNCDCLCSCGHGLTRLNLSAGCGGTCLN